MSPVEATRTCSALTRRHFCEAGATRAAWARVEAYGNQVKDCRSSAQAGEARRPRGSLQLAGRPRSRSKSYLAHALNLPAKFLDLLE